ncbi:hypothetical protein GW916_07655 [bacterium]|nr:hypothetical protein [bacterium]
MTSFKTRLAPIFCLLFLFAVGTLEAAPPERAKKNVRPSKTQVLKTPTKNPWSGWIQYDVRTDLADPILPRLYTHQFSGGVGFSTRKRLNISASLLAAYESIGANRGEVLVDQQQFFLSDVLLSVSKKYSMIHSWWMIPTLSNSFQTSELSREEGYLSITSGSVLFYRHFFKRRLKLFTAGGAGYIWNTYRISPQTLEMNPSSNFSLGLGGQWFPMGSSFFLGLEGGMKFTRYLDNTTDRVFRNSISIGAGYKSWSFTAALANGSYLNREEKTFFFIDEYRRTARIAVSYSL